MRTMSTGIERSMLVFAARNVMPASLPTRWAWMDGTAAGIRTIGASGGPFFPQPAKTMHTNMDRQKDHRPHDAFRFTTGTNNRSLLRDLRGLWSYSAAACSA